MKKFKIEKSRSTLWREARIVAVLQPADEADGVVYDKAEFNIVHQYAEHDAVDSSDNGLSYDEECQMPNEHVLSYDSELNFDCSRWIDDDDSYADQPVDSLLRELAQWSVKNHISMTANSSLLSILKPHLPCLPKSAQTLRNTLRNTSHVMKTVSGGEYCHLGLTNGLTNIVKQNCITLDNLELQFNVDGIPLFKSSNLSLWPILCLVKNVPLKTPFVVGMFCGKEKPGSAS